MTQARIRIRTPENVELEYQLAGIGSRAVAQLIDLLILLVFYVLLGIADAYWGIAHKLANSTVYLIGISILLIFFLFWGYFILFEYYMSGQTLGKRLLKIRVVHHDGRNSSFLPVLLRNLFRLIDILPSGYLVGVIVMLVDKRERRIGDLVAGTMVVKATASEQFLWLDEQDSNSAVDLRTNSSPQRQGDAFHDGQKVAQNPEFQVVDVKGSGLHLGIRMELPPSWQTLLLNMEKRLRNMTRDESQVLAERTWARLVEEKLIQLVNADGTDVERTDLLVTNSEKLKFIVALAQRIRQQQRGNHG